MAMVVGFLGSGTTTPLRRIAPTLRDRRLFFLVNEFSAADVDGTLVRKEGGHVTELRGGSLFGRCRTTAFLGNLERTAHLTREGGDDRG